MVEAMAQARFALECRSSISPSPSEAEIAEAWRVIGPLSRGWRLAAEELTLDEALDVLGETLGTKPLLLDPLRLLAVMRG